MLSRQMHTDILLFLCAAKFDRVTLRRDAEDRPESDWVQVTAVREFRITPDRQPSGDSRTDASVRYL